MQYVYVLTSTPKDLYYEQCLMSVYSLHLHNKDAKVTVLVDDKTEQTLTQQLKRDELGKIAQIKSIAFDNNINNTQRSRIIKTSLPQYIDDDFLFIDCDTIIADDLSDILNIDYDMGAVLDAHDLLKDHLHQKSFIKRENQAGFCGTVKAGYHLNSGVMFVRKGSDTKEFFTIWHSLWQEYIQKVHAHHDQPAFNEANWRTGLKIKVLDGIWNCQPSHGGLAYIQNAKIIHYYSSEFSGKSYIAYYKLGDKALQEQIKQTGTLNEEIKAMIANPKLQFNKVHLINDKRLVSIMQSPLLFTLADIKAHAPALFNGLENLMGAIRTLGKKITKR